MKVGKFFIAALMTACFMGNNAFAQNNRERNRMQNPEQRIEHMTMRMQQKLMLDDKTAGEFATIYKEYISELQKCRFKPEAGVKKNDMTDKQIREQLEKKLDAQQKAIEVKKKYLNKFDDILNAKQLEMIFSHENIPVRKITKKQICPSGCPKNKAGQCPKANK